MKPRCLLPTILIIFFLLQLDGAHVQGKWNPKLERVLVVTKFGYQQTKASQLKDTRGFLYGDITAASYNYTSPVLLVLISKSNVKYFLSDAEYGMSCGSMLQNISVLAFESRCFQNGTSDFFRWIPCPVGHLCRDEDNVSNVIPGHQMTMQVQEPYNPEYWFVVLLACKLDKDCQWQDSAPDVEISYDLWLTNGRPNSEEASFFTFNFSFDEQNTVQILMITVILYTALATIMSRAKFRMKNRVSPQRTRVLSWIITCKTIGSSMQCLNVLVYALNGQGLLLAMVFGEILRVMSIEIMCLLLILLSRGWGINHSSGAITNPVIALWGVLASLDMVFFFCNFIFVYDTLHDIDVFSAWPGHGMLAVRIFYAIWFLTEIRKLINREEWEEKAVFLANFGAGFLVWFISLPMIGIVSTIVSLLWRFSLILALTTFANFMALACLVHQFWPTSSYRKFYTDYSSDHRRLDRDDSHEMAEYERMLYDDSEVENNEAEETSLHAI